MLAQSYVSHFIKGWPCGPELVRPASWPLACTSRWSAQVPRMGASPGKAAPLSLAKPCAAVPMGFRHGVAERCCGLQPSQLLREGSARGQEA